MHSVVNTAVRTAMNTAVRTAMNAELPTAPIALVAARSSATRPRRRPAIMAPRSRDRISRITRVVADLGSVVTLSALALLGVAAAAGMIDMAPAAEGPTYSVTFADR
jgi:hypothetical protein